MSILYNIIIYIYYLLACIAGIFKNKPRLWVSGRKGLLKKLGSVINQPYDLAWFHCASLGEFEQGRPIIEAFRKRHPSYKILLTFYSPSGYEIRKNYTGADYIFYLPVDTRSNAKEFINIVKPKVVIFIKYEFWFNYIDILYKKEIPIYIVSGIFRDNQHFFKWYGAWFRKLLKRITHFFVQTSHSEKLLKSIGLKNASVSGDTRFDRVFDVAQQKRAFPLVENFKQDSQIFLAGSTWPVDENLIFDLIKNEIPGLKFIFAPHETQKERIESLCNKLGRHCLKLSEATESNITSAKILIVDSIGILSHLYQYATIAYIGGGFGKSIHNILEAATFGNPVLFGPNFQKFQEAKDLIKLEGAFCVENSTVLIKKTKTLLDNKEYYNKCSDVCQKYVFDNKGATGVILQKIDTAL